MVAAVRRGRSLRRVARQFKVALSTLQYWLKRVGSQPLAQVQWHNRSSAPHRQPRQTPIPIQETVCQLRLQLLQESDLGFIGPESIREQLAQRLPHPTLPSVRTIARILKRHGLLDAKARRRQAPPPPGWYLPALAAGAFELDAFDVIEGLALEGYGQFETLTARRFWGPARQAWPTPSVDADFTVSSLVEFWRQYGLPHYAQFDNDTRFQGPHNRPNVLGRVVRLCLSLGVTPVFAPPRETGFQAAIESFNNLWEQKAWYRFHHATFPAFQSCSARFVAACVQRLARRTEQSPPCPAFPKNWSLDLQAPLHGTVIFLRRTDPSGTVSALGHRWLVDPTWAYRLLRCEVDLDAHCVRFYCLRRREPTQQPLLKTIPFTLPYHRFRP